MKIVTYISNLGKEDTPIRRLDNTMVDLGGRMEWGYNLAKGICGAIFLALTMIPYQAIAKEPWLMLYVVLMDFWAVTCFMRPLVLIKEDDKYVSIYKKLRYLPIARREIMTDRLKQLGWYMLKMTVAVGALQAFMGWAMYGGWSWWNILYILALTVLIPIVVCVEYIWHK